LFANIVAGELPGHMFTKRQSYLVTVTR